MGARITRAAGFRCSTGPRRPIAADSTKGFVAIFDGKTLNNWDGDPRSASREWRARRREYARQARRGEHVSVWRGGYGDFEFKVDYRMTPSKQRVCQLPQRCRVERRTVVDARLPADLDGATVHGQIYEERARGFIARRGSFVRFNSAQRAAAR